MQQRSIFYTLEQIYSADLLGAQVYGLIGDANSLQTVLGSTQSVISNLILSPTSPASLTLNLTNGFLLSQQPVDASSYGSLPANTQPVYQLAFNNQTNVVINNELSAGQAQYVLIEAGFQQQDSNATVLNYVNLSNPAVPLFGPNNTGIAQDTLRNEVAIITVKYGTPATAGSEVPPVVDSGNVAIAYIDLEAGQVTITGGEILDPSTVLLDTGHGSPTQVLAGLLNSHHSGAIGQAPKIHLAAGASQEVQGELPVANMVASNTVGAVASFRNVVGNPNGQLAGNANTNGAADFAYDTMNLLLYVCTTTGIASGMGQAVWTSVAAPLPTNLLFFGNGATGALSNTRPLPTSGAVSGEYYTAGNWVQTGPLIVTEGRFFFGGNVTFNNTVTVATEMAGGEGVQSSGSTLVGNGQDGFGLGGGQGGSSVGAGGGGGHGGAGGNAGNNGAGIVGGQGGAAYPLSSLLTGSGGGGGADAASGEGNGGGGGGSLYIESVGSVTFASGCNLTANGAVGTNVIVNEAGAGGGGSGGAIQVRSLNNVNVNSGATLAANGGNGGICTASIGANGGGGGGGIIDLSGLSVTNSGTITVTGGTGTPSSGDILGAASGSNGAIHLNNYILGRRAPS